MNKKFQNLLIKTLGLILLQGMLIITTAYSADTQEDKTLPTQDIPILEKVFINIVNKAIDDYQVTNDKDEDKQIKIVYDLSNSLTDLFKDRVAKDWIGEVAGVDKSATSIGIVVVVSKNISRPQRNAIVLSTSNFNTGIRLGTDLYSAALGLEAGDKVVFSGRFLPLPDNGDLSGLLRFTLKTRIPLSDGNIFPFIYEIKKNEAAAGMFLFEFTSIKKQK